MTAHMVTVVATCDGVETYRTTFAGRCHKRAHMLEAMASIPTRGEIATTEANARAWAIWSYTAGEQSAYRVGSRAK